MRNPRNEPLALQPPCNLPSPRTCSGASFAASPPKRRHSQLNGQIIPMRVIPLDQVLLPITPPSLDLLFAGNGVVHLVSGFEPDKPRDFVLPRISVEPVLAVLDHSTDQIRRDADIELAIKTAGQDVHAGLPLSHVSDGAARPAPEQVRGDELERSRSYCYPGLVPEQAYPSALMFAAYPAAPA